MSKIMVNEQPRIEEVVQPGRDLAGVQAPDGSFVPREELGAGVIREVAHGHEPWREFGEAQTQEGHERRGREVMVHWVAADFDAWVPPGDVERLDPAARMIAVYERDGRDGRVFKRYKLVRRAGLDHSWAVELLPEKVVRAVRSDGSAWTFDWYPLLERAYPIRSLREEPITDEEAEALTAVELALSPQAAPGLLVVVGAAS
jgi:hypothetical protein